MSISSSSAEHTAKQLNYFHYEATPSKPGSMGMFLADIKFSAQA
jgi:hypothetical protein